MSFVNELIGLIMIGENEAAVEHFLNDRLSQPMALNSRRHKRVRESFYQPVYDDPRVTSRLAVLDDEFEQLRGRIGELMLEPEWNQ